MSVTGRTAKLFFLRLFKVPIVLSLEKLKFGDIDRSVRLIRRKISIFFENLPILGLDKGTSTDP